MGNILLVNKKKGWFLYFSSMATIRVRIALLTYIIFWFYAILNLLCLRSGRDLHLGSFSTITTIVFGFLYHYIYYLFLPYSYIWILLSKGFAYLKVFGLSLFIKLMIIITLFLFCLFLIFTIKD